MVDIKDVTPYLGRNIRERYNNSDMQAIVDALEKGYSVVSLLTELDKAGFVIKRY